MTCLSSPRFLPYLILILHSIVLLAEPTVGYELTIVHNNDIHAHYEQINKYSGECSEEDATEEKCYGGEARRVTFINEARANFANTLVLNAGDWYTGTLWFNTYKGEAASYFINKENYDAICLGNHEFDRKVSGLVPFLENLTVPVVTANIDASNEPTLQGKFNDSIILERGGEKIGIFGYLTTDTAFASQPGPNVKFTNESVAVQREVDRLKAAGAKIIIGLSHTGYMEDKHIASTIADIDVIVGGHSHTFLYTGDKPSTEDIEGPYPTVVQGPSGKNVLVVQAYAWGKYMGFLNVTFDENFDVVGWSGNPVLLDKSIARDPETLAEINRRKVPLEVTKAEIVGSTAVRLEGDHYQCRLRECNTGNFLTDAMVWYHIDKREYNDTWALASIALLNGGGIRAATQRGPISRGQVLTVQPFGNTIDMIKIKGVFLKQAFENSVKRYDPSDLRGAFLQMSGARVVYDVSRPPGSRVVSVDVRCLHCEYPTYSPLLDDEEYNILTIAFLLNGGDGYDMFQDNILDKVELNNLDADVVSAYLQSNANIFPETEGRIKFINSTEPQPEPTTTQQPDPTTTPQQPDSTTAKQSVATNLPIIVHRCPDVNTNSATNLHFTFKLILISMTVYIFYPDLFNKY